MAYSAADGARREGSVQQEHHARCALRAVGEVSPHPSRGGEQQNQRAPKDPAP